MRLVLLAFLLAGCASPAPGFFGAVETRVTRDGRDFAVYRKGNVAEAIRLGYATRKERYGLTATLVLVMEEATGCRVVPATVKGDSGEIRARLTCPKQPI